jgi:hypothetical protein
LNNGFEPLFDPQKKVLPITPAFCFAHARRGFFELADIEKNAREGHKGKPVSPIALGAVRRLDALTEPGFTTLPIVEVTPPLFLNCQQRTDELTYIAYCFQSVHALNECIRPLGP